MINWFNILSANMPEAFVKSEEPEVEKSAEPAVEVEKIEEV